MYQIALFVSHVIWQPDFMPPVYKKINLIQIVIKVFHQWFSNVFNLIFAVIALSFINPSCACWDDVQHHLTLWHLTRSTYSSHFLKLDLSSQLLLHLHVKIWPEIEKTLLISTISTSVYQPFSLCDPLNECSRNSFASFKSLRNPFPSWNLHRKQQSLFKTIENHCLEAFH